MRPPAPLSGHQLAGVEGRSDDLVHVSIPHGSETLCGKPTRAVRFPSGTTPTCAVCIAKWHREAGVEPGTDPVTRRVKLRREINALEFDLYETERIVSISHSGSNIIVWIEREVRDDG